MNINLDNLDSAFLPDVFITNILLETSATPENTKTAEERLLGKGRTWNAPMNFQQLAGSTADFWRASDDPDKTLKIILSLSMMDHVDENGLTSWFYNEDLTKYLTIKVIQSKAPGLSAALAKGQWNALNNENNKQFYDIKNISVKKENTSLGDFISIDTANNKRMFSVDYHVSFSINKLKPPHLSYFAFCYLDLRSLVDDYHMGFLLGKGEADKVRGKVVGERVIKGGELQLETYEYRLEKGGEVWPGPVHRMRPNATAARAAIDDANALGYTKSSGRKWMTGAVHTSNSRYLIRTKMANTKIQDYRELDMLQLMDFDLTPAANIFSTIEQGKAGTQRVIQNSPDVYFSDAFISYGIKGNKQGESKLLFQMDYNRILRDQSQFGSIIDQASNPQALIEIYKNSPIKILKIMRRRVHVGTGQNRLGTPVRGQIKIDSQESEDIIVMSGDKRSKSGRAHELRTVLNPTAIQITRHDLSPIGAIKELPPIMGTTFRTFTVSDYNATDLTDGYYQYGIQLEIRDGTVDFVNKQLKRLIQIKEELDLYYSIANMPKSYNRTSQRFKTPYIKKYYSKIRLANKPWIKTIAIFVDILTSLVTVPEIIALALRLYSFINPQTGSLEGIASFKTLLETLETKLTYILGPKIHTQQAGSGGAAKKNIRHQTKPALITVSRYFNEIWNSNKSSDLGLDYLGVPNQAGAIGLKGITTNDFKNRIREENSLYWTLDDLASVQEQLGDTSTSGISEGTKGLEHLEDVQYSYCTARGGYSGNDQVVNRGSRADCNPPFAPYIDLTNALVASSTGEYDSPPCPSPTGPQANESTSDNGNNARDFILSKLGVRLVGNTVTQFQEIVGQIYEKSSSPDPGFVGVGEILGSSDLQRYQNIGSRAQSGCEEKIVETDTITNDEQIEPLSVLFIQTVVNNGNLNLSNTQSDDGYPSPYAPSSITTQNNYNLNDSSNVVQKLLYARRYGGGRSENTSQRGSRPPTSAEQSAPPLSAEEARTVMKEVPMQYRALILEKTPVAINNWSDLEIDVFTNVETSEFARYNYNMIAKVDVLTGYNTTNSFSNPGKRSRGTVTPGRDLPLMMSPMFESLEEKHFNSLMLGKLLLCRFRQYTNTILGIGTSPGIDVKYFDQYFLLSKSPNDWKIQPSESAPAQVDNPLELARLSSGYKCLGALEAQSRADGDSNPSFQSNLRVEQGAKIKMEIF
jgi:hypothetical protein